MTRKRAFGGSLVKRNSDAEETYRLLSTVVFEFIQPTYQTAQKTSSQSNPPVQPVLREHKYLLDRCRLHGKVLEATTIFKAGTSDGYLGLLLHFFYCP